jgi:hypothetical protein
VYKTKEESSYPTVFIESLFLTAVIDAKEHRDIVTCDIPGAFLNPDINEVLHMCIDGPMAEMLVEIDPDLYGPCLTEKHGKPVVYDVKLEKDLYGTLQGAYCFGGIYLVSCCNTALSLTRMMSVLQTKP